LLPPWIARASSFLPVPLSPRIMTALSVPATVSISWHTCCIAGDSPAISSFLIVQNGSFFARRNAIKNIHSYRSESTGSSLAALSAGHTPKTTPTMPETPRPDMTAQRGGTAGISGMK